MSDWTKRLIAVFALAMTLAVGYWLGDCKPGQSSEAVSADSADSSDEVLYWVAPMDSNYRRDQPGKSPMGMDLVPVFASDATGETDGPNVQVDPQVTRNLGVRTAAVTRGRLVREMTTVGYTSWDESTITMLHPRVEGWLERFNVASAGDRLSKGDVVYELYSPKLVSAQQEYLTARSSGNRSLIRAAGSRLLALGLTTTQVNALEQRGRVDERLAYRAERDAIVTAISVRPGSFVTPQTHIATLADPAGIWIDAEILQSQAGWVEPGLDATATVSAWPAEVWQGKVAYVYPELDPLTRTLRVRLQFGNPALKLKPNMFANLRIFAAPRENVLVVPREAVIPAEGGDRVVTALGEGRFAVKPVRTGISNMSQVEIIDGLRAGEQLVTSGQFLIDSEANGAQALERLSALQTVTVQASIAGFPQLGRLRLVHEPVSELDWPSANKVFNVANAVNLMPYNKQDRVEVVIQEMLDGDWQIVAIEPVASQASDSERLSP